ncbi:MAG: hypothetical protein U5M23_14445 [Marinagarivorans sp.]|nr:hypothetical protein [Marinagarivorans sp.]
MKCLTIQIHPLRDTSYSYKDVLFYLRNAGRSPEVDIVEDDGNWVNLNFFSENLLLLWSDIQTALKTQPELAIWLARVGIIACEGEQGWDDLRLLAHYDPSETITVLVAH